MEICKYQGFIIFFCNYILENYLFVYEICFKEICIYILENYLFVYGICFKEIFIIEVYEDSCQDLLIVSHFARNF